MRRMLAETRMGTHEHERVGKDMTIESKAIQAQIEETRHAQKQRSPEDYRCPYCWGKLWVEYIENGRYLVKCDREKDRIQCDDCLRVWSNEGEPRITTLHEVIFNSREPGPRLCAECWQKRGWEHTSTRGWVRI